MMAHTAMTDIHNRIQPTFSRLICRRWMIRTRQLRRIAPKSREYKRHSNTSTIAATFPDSASLGLQIVKHHISMR
jgi:hypothetical protein